MVGLEQLPDDMEVYAHRVTIISREETLADQKWRDLARTNLILKEPH